MANKDYNSISSFELGKIFQTKGIYEARKKNVQFDKEVIHSLTRYCLADFKDMAQEDIDLNESAIANGDDRIFGAYNTCLGKIYIITEWDRSCTTILFPDEY